MLVKNPVTSVLYRFGYTGMFNIFEFWNVSRDEIIPFIYSRKSKIRTPDNDLEEFELKIRWAAPIGVWYRFEIKTASSNKERPLNFEEIIFKFGRQEHRLNDFIDSLSCHVSKTELTDLRGISIIQHNIENTVIRDVDFSYATLDSSKFRKVSFVNCRFDHTSFSRCRIVECDFDESCFFNNNDFSDAYVSGNFESMIVNPTLKPANWWTMKKMKLDVEVQFLHYSKIISSSFANNCTPEHAKHYLLNFQRVLNN